LKSVEFLSILSLLLLLYSLLFTYYTGVGEACEEKVRVLREELEKTVLSSLLSSMCSYGTPFEYEGKLPRAIPDTGCAVYFDPLTNTYTYATCGRLE